MHAQTEERTSAPTTIYAGVGASRALTANTGFGIRGSGFADKRNGPHSSRTPNTEPRIPASRPPRFVVTLDAPLGAGDPLVRIPLAVTGRWVRDGSDFSITLGDLEAIVKNFSKRGNGEINVDYDHSSEMPEVGAGGPVPSAGRIVKLGGIERLSDRVIERLKEKNASNHSITQSPNRAILPNAASARYILWGWYEPTERARQLIESREYRYISPAINWAGRDKRTGKVDGTTLTSVALTNRPFLEELPQIRLSDPAYQLVDVGEVHVDTSLGQGEERKAEIRKQKSESRSQKSEIRNQKSEAGTGSAIANSQGGLMKQVKLSVEEGKIKVAHEDFSDDYYADPAEMKQCLDDLGGDSGGEADATDESEAALAELEALAGLAGDAATGGQEGATAASAGAGMGAAGTGKLAKLSECVTEIRRRLEARQEISLKEATALLSEAEAGGKSISAADYFRGRVEEELDQAVRHGKVLPRQRDDWRKIALSDFPTFRKIVAEQKAQVALRPVGLSGAGPEDAQTQVKLLTEQRMRERSISFGQALSEIGREQPELVHQYRRAVSGGEA